jgi:hypothetical protein
VLTVMMRLPVHCAATSLQANATTVTTATRASLSHPNPTGLSTDYSTDDGFGDSYMPIEARPETGETSINFLSATSGRSYGFSFSDLFHDSAAVATPRPDDELL